jgi:hypothetical protein
MLGLALQIGGGRYVERLLNLTHVVGLGERLGLLNSFRSHGWRHVPKRRQTPRAITTLTWK